MEVRKVLELVEAGELQELKALCKEELYTNALAKKAGAKQRYSAMKRYLKGVTSSNDMLKSVGIYKEYNAFCNGYSAVVTREDIGDLPRFDSTKGEYLNLDSIMNITGEKATINTTELFAKMASLGYKYKITEKDYLLHIADAYFNFALFDSSFSIIRDTDNTEVILPSSSKSPILLETTFGKCAILPVHMEGINAKYKVVEVEIKG